MPGQAEFDRAAVITLQGGGIYGLSLLGQLDYVVNDLRIDPLALAGTSAGAIVATLLWAGYTPRKIRDRFIEVAKTGTGLVDLLGPFEPDDDPFTFQTLTSFVQKYGDIAAMLNRLQPLFELIGGSDESRFARFRHFPRRAYQALRTIAAVRESFHAGGELGVITQHLRRHIENRGMFTGERLEHQIEDWLRESPRFKQHADELPGDRLLLFSDVHTIAEKNRKAGFAPLFLTATNLKYRRLELFNSIDEKYRDVPIARAVRASAGVPFFFQPVAITLGQEENWFVDGGFISNFPSWVFSDALRRQLARSLRFRALASRAWVHIGLRLSPPEDTEEKDIAVQDFRGMVGAVADLATGRARDELEGVLTSFVARSWLVRQPISDTGGPKNFLAVGSIKEETIHTMYAKGKEHAERAMGQVSFDLPPAARVKKVLSALVEQVLIVLSQDDNSKYKFRTNIFLPNKQGLRLCFSAFMDGDPDEHMEFAAFDMGLTGFCFSLRRPCLGNLEKIAKLVQEGALQREQLFNMPPELHNAVRKDRTWLASMPIFDPDAVYSTDMSALPPPLLDVAGQYYLPLQAPVDGAVLGVLNLDAALPYVQAGIPDDPAVHWTNVRIKAIIRLLESTSRELATIFSDAFASPRRPENVAHG